MEIALNIISLVVSISAVLVSIYVAAEARKERKQDLKLVILKEHLNRLKEAKSILTDIPVTGNRGTVQFNQICALKKIVDNNYLDLGQNEYNELKDKFTIIYDNYERVSGKRLNMFDKDLQYSCALYGEMDYPEQLSDFYDYIINMIKSAILSGHFESAFYTGKHFLYTNSNNLNNDKLAEVYMWEAFACAGIYKEDLFVQYKNLALNLSPKNPQVYWILGNIYWKIYDDTSNAIDNYQKALNLMPKENLDYFIFSMELAQIYKNLGDITKAYAIAYNMIISQKELPNIENINPLDTPIYLTYAKAYDILGNTQLAKICYQIAFNLNPNIDIPEKYYPNNAEKLQYLPSIIIDINDKTAIELKTNIFD